MVKLFFMVVYYSLLRWFVQSDIVDCINSCSRLYSPLPESVVVNCMIRVSYKENDLNRRSNRAWYKLLSRVFQIFYFQGPQINS